MTKGITKLFVGAAMLASVATAETDLFAKLSNGALSDKSEGIAELSKAEKAKVVGGYQVFETSFFNRRDGWYSFQTGMVFRPLSSNSFGGKLLSYTMDVNWEDLVMLTRYNYNPGGYNYQFVIADRMSGRIKRTTWGYGPAYILDNYDKQAQRHNERFR